MRSSGVIGSGTMGGGIALCLITSGIPCVLIEQKKEVGESDCTTLGSLNLDTSCSTRLYRSFQFLQITGQDDTLIIYVAI